MPRQFSCPEEVMQRALEIASHGIGFVEPNPAVGAVIVNDALEFLAEGFHKKFGGPHAEIEAIHSAQSKGIETKGKTIFVTLEPCAHEGKTPPCADAVLQAGFKKVVIGCPDPASHTSGQGIKKLEEAGLVVETGCLKQECQKIIRPFRKLMTTGTPYVHAKWAMTLDGKIATKTGSSKWISCEKSRKKVHQLRGKMDAILIGSGTLKADDPLLTTRPAGERIATRIVLDSRASISENSQLVRTISEAPVLVCCLKGSLKKHHLSLEKSGVEFFECEPTSEIGLPVPKILEELGQRKMTNLLVEGGAKVLGSFFDMNLIDETHVFIAPKVVGGADAPGPIGGIGQNEMSQALVFEESTFTLSGSDFYFHSLFEHSPEAAQ